MGSGGHVAHVTACHGGGSSGRVTTLCHSVTWLCHPAALASMCRTVGAIPRRGCLSPRPWGRSDPPAALGWAALPAGTGCLYLVRWGYNCAWRTDPRPWARAGEHLALFMTCEYSGYQISGIVGHDVPAFCFVWELT